MAVLAGPSTNVPVIPNSSVTQQDRGASKKASGNNNSSDAPVSDQGIENVLKDYEKTKAALIVALLKSTNGHQVPPLKGSDLDKAMGDNPVWQSIVNPSGAATAASDGWKPDELSNFFLSIFTYLRNHRDEDSKDQVAQSLAMLTEQTTLDNVTHESTTSLDEMKHSIHKAEKKANSPLGKFLKIGLPILLAGVTLAITIGTMGAGAAAAGAMTVAIQGAVEGAVTGAETGIEAAVEAGVEEGLSNAIGAGVDGMTEVPENMVEQVTQKVTQTVTTGLKQAVTSAVSELGSGASPEAINTAVQTAVKQVVQDAVKQAIEEVVGEAGSVADGGTTVAVSELSGNLTTALSDAVPEAIKDVVQQGVGASLRQGLATLPLRVVMVVITLMVTATGVAGGTAPASVNQQESSAISNATTIEQGLSGINSAASDALQNGIKEGTQDIDNANQDMQATLSQLQQAITAMTQVNKLGNF